MFKFLNTSFISPIFLKRREVPCGTMVADETIDGTSSFRRNLAMGIQVRVAVIDGCKMASTFHNAFIQSADLSFSYVSYAATVGLSLCK